MHVQRVVLNQPDQVFSTAKHEFYMHYLCFTDQIQIIQIMYDTVDSWTPANWYAVILLPQFQNYLLDFIIRSINGPLQLEAEVMTICKRNQSLQTSILWFVWQHCFCWKVMRAAPGERNPTGLWVCEGYGETGFLYVPRYLKTLGESYRSSMLKRKLVARSPKELCSLQKIYSLVLRTQTRYFLPCIDSLAKIGQ